MESSPSVSPPSPLFNLRLMTADDVPFIFSSWLKSYRDAFAVRGIPHTVYYHEQHGVIERILQVANVVIACNVEDTDQIYGYGVGERIATDAVVHWLYCKHPFRGNGVARALFGEIVGDASKVFYSHRSKMTELLVGKRPFVYNPYLSNKGIAA